MTPTRLLFSCTAVLVLAACPPTPAPAPTPTPTPELPGPLATLDIRAGASTVAVGGTVQFTVVGHDAKGNAVAFSPVWSATAGGSINGAGVFTAGTRAATFPDAITVRSEGVSTRASVTVTPGPLATLDVTPGAATLGIHTQVRFTCTGVDAYGNAVVVTPAWSVPAAAGTITSDGLFTAGAISGVFADAVHATQGALVGKASLTIEAGQAITMSVVPGTSTVAVGGSVQFTMVATDGEGNLITVTPSWSAAFGGSISSTGLFTAGNSTGFFPNAIRASLGTLSATASVTVGPGALARLSISPLATTLPVNGLQRFFAIGKDAAGNTVPVTPVWSVVGGGGTISVDGLFTAGRSAGVFVDTVKVSSGLLSDYVTVTVTSDTLSVITVTPSLVSLATGTTQLFTAFGRDVNGNSVAISPTWSTVSGGTIASTGLLTAGTLSGSFTDTVRATVGGITGLASFTVTPGPLASITITGPSSTMALNSTLQFTATGRDANGNLVSLTPSWSVVAGGGTITSLGLFSSGTVAGTFTNTIRAASGTLSATATVTVTPGALASLAITPLSSTLNIGQVQLMSATGRDAFNNVVAVTPTWAVLTGGGAITPTGSFTAGSVSGTFTDTIRASSGTITALASIIVNPGALASIVVTGNTPAVTVNTTRQLAASGRDSSGNVVPVTVVWSVLAGGGTISTGGLFTAGNVAGTFTNTISAASGAISGLATMTVSGLPPGAIALGSASTYAVLAGSAIVNAGPTALTGDVGLRPGVAISGFPPGTVTGTMHINDSLAAQAQTDLTSAFLSAQGKVCPTGNDKSGFDLGATPFAPGVYCYSSTAGLTGTLILDGGGDNNAVFVFQVASALTTNTGSAYTLRNGARATNVFWVVGSSATLGVNSSFPGTILALTDFTMNTGATLLGRGLVRNGQVTLDSNPVTVPAP